MKHKRAIHHKLYQVVEFLETVMAFVIILVICALIVPMIHNFIKTPEMFHQSNALKSFIEIALNIVISIEFAKMLVCHSSINIIEVLLFALSRHIILAHGNALDTLLGIIGVAILFAIRKCLLTSADQDVDNPL
ncbi:MAG: hypothetical protein Q4D55_11130 [Eubacteriales bacterium]|nr:hypothetical protein [Eubacteriales bacterium]